MRSRPRIGEVFHHAISNEKGTPYAPPSKPIRFGAPMFYKLGIAAAGVFAVGAFLQLIFTAAPSFLTMESAVTLLKTSGLALIGGALLLAVAWVGLLRSDHGGIPPLVGCVVLPIAILYFYDHRNDRYSWETTLAILGVGVGGFPGVHVFARGIHTGVRVIAALTLIPALIVFTAQANHWHLSSPRGYYLVTCGGLTATGLALAANLAFLAHAAATSRSEHRDG
jgi:hypothetical protein